MKHTPGPWMVGSNKCAVYDVNGLIVASAQYDPPGRANSFQQMKANAALIAAAPELLEAVKRLRARMDEHPEASHLFSVDDYMAAVDAIRKAEGDQ